MNRTARPGEVNGDLVDIFTTVHFAAGFGAAKIIGVPLWGALALAIGFELVEDSLKDSNPGVFPNATHDSTLNSIGDVLAFMAGWAVGHGK